MIWFELISLRGAKESLSGSVECDKQQTLMKSAGFYPAFFCPKSNSGKRNQLYFGCAPNNKQVGPKTFLLWLLSSKEFKITALRSLQAY